MSLTDSIQNKQPGVINCKAAVAWGPGEAMVIEEVELSPPQTMEIRVKVVCTSLCRSDVTAWLSQVAQGAKMRGASQIIGVDTMQEKYEKAKAFGVTDFLNPNDTDESIPQGWGLTVTLGVPKLNPMVTAHYGLLLTGRTLTGSLFGGWKPKSEIPSLVDMYLKKEIEIDDLITHNLPFEDINTAFDLMKNRTCLRCVIHMPTGN
ncbi:hypothetical protein RND71_010250 [Anisodus tanguticus]|uniref:Alcohol dehydrogenase-like C-terminal domain-containing protein n=1 Tax=Anisodus tanguticus TaxID=243964 RepID=A0AAE1SJD4_9SOLA|nr:hypothetical protein RND71_010250 [Anisodus tanguticus]